MVVVNYLSIFSSFLSWVVDPPGAQRNVIEIADSLGLNVSVAVAYEVSVKEPGNYSLLFLEVLWIICPVRIDFQELFSCPPKWWPSIQVSWTFHIGTHTKF